jgi:tRNA pseudouridine55 synthase
MGHAGTLDPLATGLMLVLLGKACKQAMELTKLDKTYVAEITLGETSTTDDGEGDKQRVSELVPSLDEIKAALGGFVGEISQVPSVYSAIKIDGREAYKRTRAGESVTIPTRNVTIYRNDLTRYDYPRVQIETDVSSGTYVRSLARDLGEALETGAYLSGLIRTRVGQYALYDAAGLGAINSSNLHTYLKEVGT